MYRECRHIKAGGSKCDAPALKGKPYCYFHHRLHHAIHQQKSSSDVFFDLPPLEDRASIQIALSHVVRALATGSMDPQRAGRMIYALQVNLQFAHNTSHYADSDSVESLTRSKDGDDLAPEEFVCDDDEDCQTCPYYDECDRKIIADEADEDDEDDTGEEEDTEDAVDENADASSDAEDATEDKGNEDDAGAARDSGEPVAEEEQAAESNAGAGMDLEVQVGEAVSAENTASPAEESSSEDSEPGDSEEEDAAFTVEDVKNHKDYIDAREYLDFVCRIAGLDPGP